MQTPTKGSPYTDMPEDAAEKPKILPLCYKVVEHENVVWVCDGAANVGQIGHAVGVLLTNMDLSLIHI